MACPSALVSQELKKQDILIREEQKLEFEEEKVIQELLCENLQKLQMDKLNRKQKAFKKQIDGKIYEFNRKSRGLNK